jgi:hypothetical protein
MEITRSTKTFSFLLIMCILISGCASTTLFTTEPAGATVYIKEKAKGTTPYIYSDTKIVFSSTPITFKKDGYKDLNVVLKRNERPTATAIASGLFLYFPLLWAAEYKGNHFYKLERTDAFKQDSTFTAEQNINSVSNPDSAFTLNQVTHPVTDTILTVYHNEFTDTSSVSQVVPGMDFTKRTISKFGAGIGICLKGAFLGLNYTFIGSKSWGASISYNANPFKTRNIPSDYDRPFSPKDYVNVVSLNLLRAFPGSKSNSRFSIEAGPSLVSYSTAEIELSPHYDPNYEEESWFWNLWNGNSRFKYDKSHSGNNTIGASIMAKMEFLYSPSASIGITLFTNINSLRTIAGFGFYYSFGDVRD